MTSPIKRGIFGPYQDHLTYPIVLVTNGGFKAIVEMSGKELNEWKKRKEMTIHPTRWFIVNMLLDGDTTQHVFSGSYGGYGGSDTWRLSTKIVKIEKKDKTYEFETISGTLYSCNILAYGASNYMSDVYDSFVRDNPGALSIDESYKTEFEDERRKPRVL